MKRRGALRAASVAMLMTLGTVIAAEADPPSSGRVGGHRGGSVQRPHASFRGHAFNHHRFHARPFTTVVILPPAFYTSPFYAAAPTYVGPPAMYYPPAPPPVASVSSTVMTVPVPAYNAPSYGSPGLPPSPTPPVVEFPTGRYELRGNGIGTPYTWVWIPNPPTAPPPAPAVAPPTGAPASGDGLPASRSQVYTWVDNQGVEHWTNRADRVPARK